MKLKRLCKDLPVQIKGNQEISVTGLSSDSRRVIPGHFFIAKKGNSGDEVSHLVQAKEAGAVAVLTDLYHPFLKGVTQVITPEVRELIPILANRYYHTPSKGLFMVGITGTDGKTTTAYIAKHLLEEGRERCGMLGTIVYDTLQKQVPATLTTPDVVETQSLLREMIQGEATSAVMEVSSHALDQRRVEGIVFNVAVFTNLAQDHLDYHKTMEKYLAAKGKLFSSVTSPTQCALINRDDPHFAFLSSLPSGQVISYGMEEGADLRGRVMAMSLQGCEVEISFRGNRFVVLAPLLGEFNVYNLLAAVGVALLKGIDIPHIQKKVSTLPPIPGRLERIENSCGINFFVDFAHTPQALEKVLKVLKPLTSRRLLLVFGAGGERDEQKRPLMGKVAALLSDELIVTSDNPRGEDPKEIIKQIIEGFPAKTSYLIEEDRRLAIRHAISLSRPGDTLVLAGRGHEMFQKIGGRSIPFEDRVVAEEELRGERVF